MRQLYALLAFAALTANAPAPAAGSGAEPVPAAALARCAAIGDALQRLECYDRLARRSRASVAAPAAAAAPSGSAPPAPRALAPPPGKWKRRLKRDARGALTAVTLSLAAARQAGGIGGAPVTLVLSCRDAESTVAIDWQNYLGGDDVPVTLRLDGGPGAKQLWAISPDGSRAAYPGDAMALIGRLSAGHTLQARANPYGGHAIEATFELAGLAQAAAPLREACDR